MPNTPAVREGDREVTTYEPRNMTEPIDPIEPATIYPVDPNFVTDEEGTVSDVSGRSVTSDKEDRSE